jgi:hypothetical protein
MLIEIASFVGPALFAQLMLTVKDRSVFDSFVPPYPREVGQMQYCLL